ncbi:MAG: hypothetical protein EBS29_01200, partial [Chloroflexia bacterium]|nr:hypothetical protein [Chloroflexia bacterium]
RPPHIPASHTAYIINAFVAVLAQTITHVTTAPVHIKWPNDIVIMDGTQRRKLAGVLCEARIVAHHIDSICIGWGVNVNAHPQHHSDAVDLARASSAVNDWTTQPISRADILVSQLNAFERVYQQLQHDPTAYQAHWRQLVPIVGTTVTITRHDIQLTGTVTQLHDDGSIVVATRTGQHVVHSGIIQFD